VEEKYLKLDGTPIDVEVSGVSLIFRDQASVLIFARDITKRKIQEREVIKTQKLESLGVLAGGIAHDLNNLLQGVVGNAGLAKAYLSDHDLKKVSSAIERIESASQSATDLSYRFLAFSNGGTPFKQVTSIESVINRALRLSLPPPNITCTCALAPALCPVEIDEEQMIQALQIFSSMQRRRCPRAVLSQSVSRM